MDEGERPPMQARRYAQLPALDAKVGGVDGDVAVSEGQLRFGR